MRGEQPWRTNRARVLSSHGTTAEDRLWEQLRGRQLGGYKFVRQYAIGNYFADFVCRDLRLVVEVDGGTHSTPTELTEDANREAAICQAGYAIFRVGNAEVAGNLDGVLTSLLAELKKRAGRRDA